MKRSQTEGSALSRQGSAATNLTTASWDANSSSNHCSICLKSFGRLLQRKHHCRHCGRLVCANCSMKRIALPNNHGIQGINSDVLMTSGASPQPSGTPLLASSGPSQPNGPPVRVCDPCHRVILAKFEKQQQQIQLLDKKLELLKLTSYISDCLLDVFTLDGQFKTICYDESTTIGELMWSIVGIRMACFEVEQDLYSTQSYALLLEHQSIASIMLSWKQRGWKHSKIVIAIYDGQQVFTSTAMLNVTSSNTMTFSGFGNKLKLRSNVTTSSSSTNPYNKGSTTTNGSNATLPNSISMNSMEEQGMEGSTNGIGMTTNDDSIATHTTHSNSVDEFIALQREIERLQIELDKSNRKIDTWR